MIKLMNYKSQLFSFYAYLVNKMLNNELTFVDDLELSAIGARICYSSATNFTELISDPKISDRKERFKFLEKLYNAEHDSVFAHSPVLFKEKGNFKKFNVFKLWQFYDISNDVTYFCANARHLIEALRYKNLDFKVLTEKLNQNEILKNLSYVFKQKNSMNVVTMVFKNTHPWYWASVIAFK